MGRELKCPICWSLPDSAVSLTCNHVFCNSCIEKSMKSASNCPVCKVPFRRREVRPAPLMDNLNAPDTKLSDGEKQCEGDANCSEKEASGTHQDQSQEKKKYLKGKGSKKKTGTSKRSSATGSVKPSFPAKKRVQVTQSPLSETPLTIAKLGGSLNDFNKEATREDSDMSKEEPLRRDKKFVLSPFFWLREKDDEDSSQETVGDEPIDTSTPNAPSFSDLKDSDDEGPSKVDDTGELDDVNQEINSVEVPQVLEANKLSSVKTKFEHLKEGNGFADVLHPSANSPQIKGSDDQNGVKKSRKRGRKPSEKAHKVQTARQSDQVNGIDVELNGLSKVNHELTENGNISSNWERANGRGKSVCSNTSTKPAPQTSQAALDTSGVLINSEVNLLDNLSALPCEQELRKDSILRNADKNQRKRSGKRKLDHVENILE
ncbi:hypothetical protein L6164_037255 [Bauhinia variegata]|uniref:Uncharacterized protein n=1 Tax=Bauhinia variegata TaxID=167791 RepID=A0ACB9KJL7_BAUVA|nr:hypothetical protein L6164_037255 [Bauhinia variegata]